MGLAPYNATRIAAGPKLAAEPAFNVQCRQTVDVTNLTVTLLQVAFLSYTTKKAANAFGAWRKIAAVESNRLQFAARRHQT